MTQKHKELRAAVKSFLEIGKRDLTNPKYDGYFQELRRLVGMKPCGHDDCQCHYD